MNYDIEATKRLKDIDRGKKIVIYPFGERGKMAKGILNGLYNIQEYMIVDNILCMEHSNIKSLSELEKVDLSNVLVLITSDRPDIHEVLLENLHKIVPENQCIELFPGLAEQRMKDANSRRNALLKKKKIKEAVFKKIDAVSLESNNMIYHPVNTNSKFFLPYVYMDVIQQDIFLTDDYYEIGLLRKVFCDFRNGYVKKMIESNKGLCLDVGANIGNHTLYMANELNAKVVCFEPIYETFRILRKNMELNQLDEKVTIYNYGLSDHEGDTEIIYFDYENIGGTGLSGDEGDVPIKTLDSFHYENVSFIKIDVEGMEIEVLRGGEKTIDSYHPIIMIESFPFFFPEVEKYLISKGYTYIKTAYANYLFYLSEEIPE